MREFLSYGRFEYLSSGDIVFVFVLHSNVWDMRLLCFVEFRFHGFFPSHMAVQNLWVCWVKLSATNVIVILFICGQVCDIILTLFDYLLCAFVSIEC